MIDAISPQHAVGARPVLTAYAPKAKPLARVRIGSRDQPSSTTFAGPSDMATQSSRRNRRCRLIAADLVPGLPPGRAGRAAVTARRRREELDGCSPTAAAPDIGKSSLLMGSCSAADQWAVWLGYGGSRHLLSRHASPRSSWVAGHDRFAIHQTALRPWLTAVPRDYLPRTGVRNHQTDFRRPRHRFRITLAPRCGYCVQFAGSTSN